MSHTENFGLNLEQIKVYFFKGMRLWYIILICLILGLSFSFYKARYNVPTYKVNGRVLVKEEWKGYGADNFLPGMEVVNQRSNITNNIGIIKSFPLMENVVSDLPHLKFSYYDIGNVRRTELYKNNPFSVLLDSITDPLIYGKIFSLRIIDKTKYLLSTDGFDKDPGISYLFDQKIELLNNKLTIVLNKLYDGIANKTFQFQSENMANLAKIYQEKTSLSVDFSGESSILIIGISGTNSAKEIDVVNSIMKNFIQYGLDEGDQQATNTLNFVTEQLYNVRDSLLKAETNLELFKANSNLQRIDVNGESLIKQITELEKKRLELEFTLSFSKETIRYITNNNDAQGIVIPYFITQQSVLFRLMSNLIDKYAKRESLKFQVKESNTIYQILLKDINVAKSILLVNLTSLKNKTENDYQVIKEQLRFLETKLLKIPKTERAYAIAMRNYIIQSDLYTFLLNKRQEAGIAKSASIPKATIIDYATPFRVRKTSVTNKSLYYKYTFMFIFISILIIILIELSYTKIVDKNDITRLTDIPIIGNVGHNKDNNNLILLDKPKSLLSESFRTIRTYIQYFSKGDSLKVIMLTSSVSGEGKTFCSMNVALSYALLNKKTLLIGADLRKPRIYDDFNVSNTIGLSTLIIGKCDINSAIQKTDHENLDLITSGPIPPNPSELLSSNEFIDILTELKTKYDRIILDTSPIGLVTDARILIDYSDIILLIIRQKYTTLSNLKKINEELQPFKSKTAIVVNDIEQEKIGYGGYTYGYGYGYGYGSGYGYGYYDEETNNSNKNRFFKKKRNR